MSGMPLRASFTLGVEEEYQLVDPVSGALKSRARAVLAGDWSGEIKPEMQQNTLEVGTRVCGSAAEAGEELARLRLQAAVAAEAQGVRVAAAGTHPFSHWAGQAFTDAPVYERLHREYRSLAESQLIFGMHVHVALPSEVDRLRVMNVARLYLPHLLALTASSPFFLGEDTGYASYRSILWRRWPRAGVPPRFADEAEFAEVLRLMLETGRIDAPGRLYWDVRPHHAYRTLEFRVADVTPRLEDAVLAAALARALVLGIVEGVLREPELPEPAVQALLGDAAWRAARDGLDAEFVDVAAGSLAARPVRERLAELVQRLAPLARELGDAGALEELPRLLERGGAATRMRAVQAQRGDAGLVQWLADETLLGLGLDRRAEQRR